MLITCFASCLEMWDVIWEMRFKFVFCLRLFETIRSRDHAWSSHHQFCWSSSLIFLTSDACSFSIIEWRMPVFGLSSGVYDETSLNLTKHLIKLIVSDSSNLTKRLIKLDEWKHHLIKSDEDDSSNFWEERQSFYFLMSKNFCSDTWCEKLSLAEDSLLCEDKCLYETAMINERS
jgi:hypothetical protein